MREATMVRWIMASALAAMLGTAGCERRAEPASLRVFLADSLARPFEKAAEAFKAEQPGVELVQIPSGSVLAARKLTDGNDQADVLAVADYGVIDRLLRPDHADWSICFATNEIVIAYTDMSRYAADLTAESWPEVLARPDVRVQAASPLHDPCGYWTELCWRLADLHYPPASGGGTILDRMTARCGPAEDRRSDSQEVLRLLEASGGVDYAFVYLSQARQHNLAYLRLPPAVSLGDIDQVATYRRVAITLPGSQPGQSYEKRGDAILFAVTIPRVVRNAALAERYVAFLLSPEGRAILAGEQLTVLERPWTVDGDRIPAALRPLVAARPPSPPP